MGKESRRARRQKAKASRVRIRRRGATTPRTWAPPPPATEQELAIAKRERFDRNTVISIMMEQDWYKDFQERRRDGRV